MAFLDELKDSFKLDELKDSLNEMTRTVAEKSSQFVGIQKLRLKETTLKSDVKKTYLELGKKVYEESNAGVQFSEDVTALVEKIEAGLAAVIEVQQQIEAAKAAANDDDIFAADDDDDVFEAAKAPEAEDVPEKAAEAPVEEEATEAEEAAPAAEEETSEEKDAE